MFLAIGPWQIILVLISIVTIPVVFFAFGYFVGSARAKRKMIENKLD